MGTDIVAIVNALIDVVKEVFDSSPKLRRSAYQRSRYELTRAGQRRLTDGYAVTRLDGYAVRRLDGYAVTRYRYGGFADGYTVTRLHG